MIASYINIRPERNNRSVAWFWEQIRCESCRSAWEYYQSIGVDLQTKMKIWNTLQFQIIYLYTCNGFPRAKICIIWKWKSAPPYNFKYYTYIMDFHELKFVLRNIYPNCIFNQIVIHKLSSKVDWTISWTVIYFRYRDVTNRKTSREKMLR